MEEDEDDIEAERIYCDVKNFYSEKFFNLYFQKDIDDYENKELDDDDEQQIDFSKSIKSQGLGRINDYLGMD